MFLDVPHDSALFNSSNLLSLAPPPPPNSSLLNLLDSPCHWYALKQRFLDNLLRKDDDVSSINLHTVRHSLNLLKPAAKLLMLWIPRRNSGRTLLIKVLQSCTEGFLEIRRTPKYLTGRCPFWKFRMEKIWF
jgi:hypothetical protein